MSFAQSLLADMALAAIPAVGFGVLFHVPPRILPYCAIFGAVGHGVRFFLMELLRVPIAWGTYLAATLVSFSGVFVARRVRAHPKVFTVAAMIPMVPGVQAYTAMLAVVQLEIEGFSDTLFETAVESSLSTFFVVGALAVGLAMPGLLLYRRSPVV